jgi:glutathione synthase
VHLSDVQEYLMTLRVAVQMDPIAGINIAGDSTFALMLSAQARGHTMWYYDVGSLAWEALGDGPARVTAWAAPVTVRRPAEGETHYELGAFQVLDLVEDVDVVLMRQDPPFDLGYITGAHILEKLKGRTLVVNDPEQVRNARKRSSSSTLRSSCPHAGRAADRGCARVPEAVGRGRLLRRSGYQAAPRQWWQAVFRVPASGDNLGALVEVFSQMWPEPYMVQPFLPDVAKGDKRIVLVDGVVAGAINRRPGAGEFRSNLAVGGSAEATELTPHESRSVVFWGRS